MLPIATNSSVVPYPPHFIRLQRDAFLHYMPAHRQGVTFIILTTSITAVVYNLVRGSRAWSVSRHT